LTTSVHEAENLSLDQIEAFLNASEEIRFEGENREQVYGWVEQVLRQQQYPKPGRKARGLVRRYLEKMTGLSRAQVTRLIARFRANGELQPAHYRRHRFPQPYTRADMELLATVDEAHETLSGPPPGAFCSASIRTTVSGSTSGWPPSRWLTCTTCATTNATGNVA
jgi:predicted DNA-binding transcriptional regulator AlpA